MNLTYKYPYPKVGSECFLTHVHLMDTSSMYFVTSKRKFLKKL